MSGDDAKAKATRVVVLRFASGIRVDLVADMSEPEAIADFASRLIAGGTVTLPLIEGLTAVVPVERLRALINAATPKTEPPPRPNLSLAGVVGAVNAYLKVLGSNREKEPEAKAELLAWFDRYGVDIDFRVASPASARA